MSKRLRGIDPIIPHYPPDNDRGAYAPQFWYGDDNVNAADGPWFDAPPGSLYIKQLPSAGQAYVKIADTGAVNDWQTFGIGNAGLGVYHAHDYGAVGNAVADDWTAIQAAINAAGAAGGGTVQLAARTYRLSAGLTVTHNLVRLVGAGMHRTTLHMDSATANAITASGGTSGLVVSDLTIICFEDSNNTRTNGCGIALNHVGDWRIENVRLLAPYRGIYCDNASTGRIYNCAIEGYSGITDDDPNAGNALLTGIALENTCISVIIRDTNIYSGAAYAYGIKVDAGMDTLVIDGCGVTNAAKCIYLNNVAKTDHDPRWVRINNCYLEPVTTTGIGIEFGECYDVEVTNIYSAWGTIGLHFANGSNGIQVRGGMIFWAYTYGILVDGGENIDIDGVSVTDNSQDELNTHDGIIIAPGVSHFSIVNCRTGNFLWNNPDPNYRQAYGINVTAGASDYYRIANNSSNGDTAGGVSDNGTGVHKYVAGNL